MLMNGSTIAYTGLKVSSLGPLEWGFCLVMHICDELPHEIWGPVRESVIRKPPCHFELLELHVS
jgi:hypothetical protein